MNECKDENECTTPMWCRGKDRCRKATSADETCELPNSEGAFLGATGSDLSTQTMKTYKYTLTTKDSLMNGTEVSVRAPSQEDADNKVRALKRADFRFIPKGDVL